MCILMTSVSVFRSISLSITSRSCVLLPAEALLVLVPAVLALPIKPARLVLLPLGFRPVIALNADPPLLPSPVMYGLLNQQVR